MRPPTQWREAELWNFHLMQQGQCRVIFTKTADGSEYHVEEPGPDVKPNTMSKTLRVCSDTDGDTVADDCPALEEEDNCKYDENPDQADSDGSATRGVYLLDVSMCIAHTTTHGDGSEELGPLLDNNCWIWCAGNFPFDAHLLEMENVRIRS